ncbi:HD domain-containing protein [Paenarthrobacter sp. C1]|uniref:HD domain-containing protein n=1 Tax=Paenarthrobacter sp. C1 TaxID=3400220 RepID=UPI003BF473C5
MTDSATDAGAGRSDVLTGAGIDSTLVVAALALYDPSLPYHNANHALHVVQLAGRFSRRALAQSVPHDPDVAVVAALLHDAGYGHHEAAADAEAHSADLAAQLLREHGWAEEKIEAVCDAIAATRLTAEGMSVEGLIVRAADLWEMGATWPVFAANRTLLRLEAEKLEGVTFDEHAWHARVSRIVGGYALGPMWIAEGPAGEHAIEPTGRHRRVCDGGVASWRARVNANLALHASN